MGDDAEVDVEAQGCHGHAEDEVGYLDQDGDGDFYGRDVRADGAGDDEAAHEPGDRNLEFRVRIAGFAALAPGFKDAEDEGYRGEEEDTGEFGDDGAVRADRAGTAAGSNCVGDFMKAQACHDAELGIAKAEEGL